MIDIIELKRSAEELRILYVEDEPKLREEIGSYLKKIFQYIDTEEDGLSGLQKYTKGSYDIVITDIQMPNMSGLEMIAKIKEINHDQEVIITSAYQDSNYFVDAIELGVNGYILKPINLTHMNRTLYKAISNLKNSQEVIRYKEHLEIIVEERTKVLLELKSERIRNYESTLLSFVEMIESRDTYTGGHSQRVANYSKLIAKEMGRSEEECDLIYQAGILHDIGKVATPDTVLLKPGKLNELEYKLIKVHVSTSYELLSKIPMYKEIAEVIKSHHERYDGNGYPEGIKGENIPLLARIMIVADAFDAMTTNRIYKGRKSVLKAIGELEAGSKKQFHPEVIKVAKDLFLNIELEESVNQLPSTDIENERFSYFFRDQITNAYTSGYLDFILNNNLNENKYASLNVVYLHNFNQYNKENSWEDGDILLGEVVNTLYEHFPLSIVFRIHGDDFIVITQEYMRIENEYIKDIDLFKEFDYIDVSTKYIDLKQENISTLKELELLL